MIIYKTTNLVNGKFYIDKDTKNNKDYFGSGKLLNSAIKKYGKQNFKKEILEICDSISSLNECEKYWIKKLNAQNKEIGYNIMDGGDGGDTFKDNPNIAEIKEKITLGQIGRVAWNKNKTNIYSNVTKEKMRNARYNLTGSSATNFVQIDKDELVKCLKIHTIIETAKNFKVSVSCIRDKIEYYSINYDEIKRKKRRESHNFYNIDDITFNKIIVERETNKKSIEALSKMFKIGVNKQRNEFKTRNIIIKRIK